MNKLNFRRSFTAALALIGLTGAAQAAPVHPDIIFGSGNDNGSFTKTVTAVNSGGFSGDIELGLRAKLRYDGTSGCMDQGVSGFGCPQNTFNWDGNSTYTFNIDNSNAPANRAAWNFEWSVNVADMVGASNPATISDIPDIGVLVLAVDSNPSPNTFFLTGNVLDGDAWFGTASTENGGGTYVRMVDGQPIPGDATVAQNSVNYGFLTGFPLGEGTFNIALTLRSSEGVDLASTSITVAAETSPVPVPAALPLLLAGFGGLAFVARRRKAA